MVNLQQYTLPTEYLPIYLSMRLLRPVMKSLPIPLGHSHVINDAVDIAFGRFACALMYKVLTIPADVISLKVSPFFVL